MSEFAFPVSKIGNSVTAFNFSASGDPVYTADSSHPAWEEILDGLRSGDTNVWSLFNMRDGIKARFKKITDRISWDGDDVLYDGDPIHSTAADHLARVIQSGDAANYEAFAKFLELLLSNPEAHSREQAYDFLGTHAFQITPDGWVVGYKGLVELADGTYVSQWSSAVAGKPSAFVNGVAVPPLSRVPQKVGDTVSMPRSEVTHDPNRACERGLHVATRSYAEGYGTVLAEVHFNPAKIVSVPTADNGAKVRVHEYFVAKIADAEAKYDSRPVISVDVPAWQGDVGYRVF